MQVIISYLILLGTVLAAWLIITASTSWIPAFASVGVALRRGRRQVDAPADSQQHKTRWPRHTDILTSTLVELQKSQIFFMLTIQTASLIALRNVNYIDASSWQQLYNNIQLFDIIGASGIYPAVLNLVTLRKAKKPSKYLVIATTCSVAISTVTWAQSFRVEPMPAQIKGTGASYPECGNVAGARTIYCQQGDYTRIDSYDFAVHQLPSPLITLLIQSALLLETFDVFRDPKADGTKCNIFGYCGTRIHRSLPFLQSKPFQTVGRLAAQCLMLFVDIWLVYNNCSMVWWQSYFLGLSPSESWTLGQIIAVAAWVPVFVEYVYLLAMGIRKGFEYRLPESYKVKDKDDQHDKHDPSTHTKDSSSRGSYAAVKTQPPAQRRDSPEEMLPLSHSRQHNVVHTKTM